MKSLRLLLAALLLTLGNAHAATPIKDATLSGNATVTGTLAGTPTGGTLSLANLTLTLPATVSGGGSTFQPLDADLTAIAALTTTSSGRSLLTASALTATGLGLTNGAPLDVLGAKSLTGTGNLVLSASPTFTGTIGAASLTLTTASPSTGVGTGALQLPSGGLYAGAASVFGSSLTTLGVTSTFGPGGAGLDNSILVLSGSDASSYGAQIRLVRNMTNLWTLGHYSGIQGGTSDDLLLYNPIAGGETLRFVSNGFSAIFGPGGTGTNNSSITIAGSSTASYGAQIKLRRGTTDYWTLGHYSGIQGGGSNDLLFYNATAGNEALKIASADSAATFAGQIKATLGTNLLPQTAPAAPASGWTLYTDSGDGNKLKAKASTGTVVTLGTP